MAYEVEMYVSMLVENTALLASTCSFMACELSMIWHLDSCHQDTSVHQCQRASVGPWLGDVLPTVSSDSKSCRPTSTRYASKADSKDVTCACTTDTSFRISSMSALAAPDISSQCTPGALQLSSSSCIHRSALVTLVPGCYWYIPDHSQFVAGEVPPRPSELEKYNRRVHSGIPALPEAAYQPLDTFRCKYRCPTFCAVGNLLDSQVCT
jgi:hypothetical protein